MELKRIWQLNKKATYISTSHHAHKLRHTGSAKGSVQTDFRFFREPTMKITPKSLRILQHHMTIRTGFIKYNNLHRISFFQNFSVIFFKATQLFQLHAWFSMKRMQTTAAQLNYSGLNK